MVRLDRRALVDRGMRPAVVVPLHEPLYSAASLEHAIVGFQVDLLVLDRAPESFDEDVVAPRAGALVNSCV